MAEELGQRLLGRGPFGKLVSGIFGAYVEHKATPRHAYVGGRAEVNREKVVQLPGGVEYYPPPSKGKR